MAETTISIEEFLSPLSVNTEKIHSLARAFAGTFEELAVDSLEQFLPTPIAESLLRPFEDYEGRYLAIDIGGTNLRVGFIELHRSASSTSTSNGAHEHPSRVQRKLERSWPIGEILKQNKTEDLFKWIGECIAEVVQDGVKKWPGELPDPLLMGVTFSFPMIQHTISEATLMGMGKGFAIKSDLDLPKHILTGYKISRSSSLPDITISAICNDTVATLISFAYQLQRDPGRKAAMGLIVGTGCNATIPLALRKLHPSKRSKFVKVADGEEAGLELKIAVNTEWTIRGAADPLHKLDFITKWDSKLDSEGEAPGFQPFEYMTAGRYLGELGRLIIVDYFTNYLQLSKSTLPQKLQSRHGLTTTFLGNVGRHLSSMEPSILKQMEMELPLSSPSDAWIWTEETANIVYAVAKAVQQRAAGMVAAATIGLLACAGEIHLSAQGKGSSRLSTNDSDCTAQLDAVEDLMVGFTGGCIVHFQDYLLDCQGFLDSVMEKEFGDYPRPRIVLLPCHDGGILGAGILAGSVQSAAYDAA